MPSQAARFKPPSPPRLPVQGGARAVESYKAAFGAVEVYHIEDPDGNVVARLSVGGAEFWLSDESPEHGNAGPASSGGARVSHDPHCLRS
jgi:PhnB protein